MIILAIETSCDDTAIAIVEAKNNKFKVLSNIVSSQIEVHKPWGGVFPSLAKREHEKNLPLVLRKALREIRRGRTSMDFIAVTVGPGLDPCLWTGVNFAKDLAKQWGLPVIPVNHIEAHMFVSIADSKSKFQISNFKKCWPAIALVVSGGHTQLILVKGIGKYKILGETRDDAAGECLDKVAKILGLGYPGGPIVANEASKSREEGRGRSSSLINLPRPMINTGDYDFSFSGLKTAVLYDFKKRKPQERKNPEYIRAMCREVQQAVIDVLLKKTAKAVREYGVKTIILGGGVSANTELRKQFKKRFNNVLVPPRKFSTDNAAMIAIAGYYNRNHATKKYDLIKAKPNLRIL